MTQGRDGISLAHRAALRFWEVARQLSVVAALFTVAALLAATADPSYAGGKKNKATSDRTLEDTVVVSNNGAILGGSLTTYTAGSGANAKPLFEVKGNHTLMGLGGVQGNAQSSLDGHIVVTSSAADLVMSFGPGSNGNTAPDTVLVGGLIGPPATPTGASPTGIIIPQGATFQNPFRRVSANQPQSLLDEDIFANSNFGNIVVADENYLGEPIPCPNKGVTIGTITEFFRTDTGFAHPLENSPVFEIPFPPATGFFSVNATIAGCNTALDGPIGVAFDGNGNLFVVNEGLAGLGAGPPGFVTKYEAGAHGDAEPIDFIGLFPPTAGAFVDPQYIAVGAEGHEIYVTDVGDNSIKIFDVSTPFDASLINTISGPGSKLNRPMGIASNDTSGGDDLYVVNNNDNSLLMFDDPPFSTPSTVIRQNNHNNRVGRTHLNLPVGVALPQFFPPLE